uniref:Serine protease F56F10.1 n=1 Tax=Heterorhabditis bacteriophora TaxID=37862 RepID=A0A1I7XJ62_HETBA
MNTSVHGTAQAIEDVIEMSLEGYSEVEKQLARLLAHQTLPLSDVSPEHKFELMRFSMIQFILGSNCILHHGSTNSTGTTANFKLSSSGMRYLILAILVLNVNSHRRRDPASVFEEGFSTNAEASVKNNWDVKWYNDMKLDHFTYSDNRIFKLKWLWNNTYYKPGGCIFFYTGNEGNIEGFASATGMMWDLAPQFNASIIFAEHRFYGETQPFDKKSYAVGDKL